MRAVYRSRVTAQAPPSRSRHGRADSSPGSPGTSRSGPAALATDRPQSPTARRSTGPARPGDTAQAPPSPSRHGPPSRPPGSPGASRSGPAALAIGRPQLAGGSAVQALPLPNPRLRHRRYGPGTAEPSRPRVRRGPSRSGPVSLATDRPQSPTARRSTGPARPGDTAQTPPSRSRHGRAGAGLSHSPSVARSSPTARRSRPCRSRRIGSGPGRSARVLPGTTSEPARVRWC
ncbi:hypothetical protein M2158_003196 [Streptomyces sp. SAI-144]|nr:hypothetical protein [Streptomyces sp. SAI-144]